MDKKHSKFQGVAMMYTLAGIGKEEVCKRFHFQHWHLDFQPVITILETSLYVRLLRNISSFTPRRSTSSTYPEPFSLFLVCLTPQTYWSTQSEKSNSESIYIRTWEVDTAEPSTKTTTADYTRVLDAEVVNTRAKGIHKCYKCYKHYKHNFYHSPVRVHMESAKENITEAWSRVKKMWSSLCRK